MFLTNIQQKNGMSMYIHTVITGSVKRASWTVRVTSPKSGEIRHFGGQIRQLDLCDFLS